MLYESPHRILKLLEQLVEMMPQRKVSVSREISKKFEETIVGMPEQVLQHFQSNSPRGEFVVVLSSV